VAALPVLAQGVPTGSVSGQVTSPDGQPLSGVTVTATSPALQGTRSATTTGNGDYNIPLLPPGDYQVSFELEGFQTAQHKVKVASGLPARIDLELALTTVTEEIVVTGTYETISAGTTAATTYEKDFVEQLPVERNIRETVLLTPGVTDTGPGGNITISGNMSFENLFLVNGVVVNENIRGQPQNLFIEDAIEETTTSTSGISAEYGRFGGGVVNTITRSGGNELHGSLRNFVTNDKWEGKTPVTIEQVDDVNQRYEGTLGGWVMKDRLWYFAAGRDFETKGSGQTSITNIVYPTIDEERRLEGKLTVSPFEGHRLIGSYIDIERSQVNNRFTSVFDLDSLTTRDLPNELRAVNYTGVLTSNFFIEGHWSERLFAFVGDGSKFTDRIRGTLLIDDEGFRWNSPTFCGVCRDEERNNENILAKASYFLSTESLGSHDIAVGYDTFDDIRAADNHQSGSDFRILLTDTIIRNGTQLFPQMLNDGSTIIVWNPILESSRGTSFVTDSFFVNDRWRLNEHWSFNLGARYDANDGKDSAGKTVTDDTKISPRLGLTYDPKGDGNWIFNANYGQYVAALANTQGDATSPAGNPATITWFYRGPNINGDENAANLLTTEEALNLMWAWFDAQGGTDFTRHIARSVSIPGGTSTFRESLRSPATEEIAVGLAKRLGTRGIFRSEYVHRESDDFYVDRRDLSTGRVTLPNGRPADLSVIENEDSGLLERVYDGLHTQFQYRLGDRLNLGGTWTWSHLRGTFDGETAGSGPVRSGILQYPEYRDLSWFSSRGDLGIDQRHRVRVWGLYDLLRTDHHRLNVSVLQNYFSGTPYGAAGAVDPRNFVTNPGYVTPPTAVNYWFTERDTFLTDNITATDLSLNYSFTWNAFNKAVEVFIQPEVLNVFNEDGQELVNVSVLDATTNSTVFARFNPFTDTPIECPQGSSAATCRSLGAHWQKGPNFGKSTTEASFQDPRTFRFSVGLRF
jgi:hypothetical protein